MPPSISRFGSELPSRPWGRITALALLGLLGWMLGSDWHWRDLDATPGDRTSSDQAAQPSRHGPSPATRPRARQ